MITLKGNILDVQAGIICHQVNCKGALGAGLGAQLKNKYPKVKTDYYGAFHKNDLRLGGVIFTPVREPFLYIASMCGQDNFQRIGTPYGKVFTDYKAFKTCLIRVKNFADAINELNNLPIYLPYNIGCGLAKGEWSTVADIIQEITPNAIIVNSGK